MSASTVSEMSKEWMGWIGMTRGELSDEYRFLFLHRVVLKENGAEQEKVKRAFIARTFLAVKRRPRPVNSLLKNSLFYCVHCSIC